MRAILQHPKLLGKVPYLLETPKYLPQYRAVRRRSKAIQALDEELCRLERDYLRDLLAFKNVTGKMEILEMRGGPSMNVEGRWSRGRLES
jgi:hypothetical protein